MWCPGFDPETFNKLSKDIRQKLRKHEKVWVLINNHYQYWFINCGKCTVVVSDVNNRGNWESLVHGNFGLL